MAELAHTYLPPELGSAAGTNTMINLDEDVRAMIRTLQRASLAATLLLSLVAHAGLDVTPGNIAQKPCDEAGRLIALYRVGTVIRGTGWTGVVKDKKTGLGNPLNPGDLVFYVALADARKTYSTDKQIEIIDKSPLTPDVAMVPQVNYPIVASFYNKAGRKFDILSVGTNDLNSFFAMVDDAGMVCSSNLNKSLVAVGLPTVYQELPIKAQVQEIPNGKITAVAITLAKVDGATVSLDETVMVNGQVEMKKSYSFDAFSGNASIAGLNITFSKAGAGGITINSIDEPADLYLWAGKLRERAR